MNTFKLLLIVFVIALEFCFQTVKCSTIQEVRKAFQETAYSYYMKSKWIQYNHYKAKFFSPEEVTSQNVNFLVCSAFVSNVYKELLNITIPVDTKSLLSHTIKNKGRSPEVVAYSPAYTTGKRIMYFYSNSCNVIEKPEPTMNDIFSQLESGDILTYSGHTFLIYNTVTNGTTNNKTDAIFIEVTSGTKSYVNSKINKKTLTFDDKPYGGDSHVLYLNTINDNNIELGAVYIDYLSKNVKWKEINKAENNKTEYSILRFIHEGNNNEAILKYNATRDQLNQMEYNSTIHLNNKTLDRKDFSHLYIEKTVDKFNGNIVEIGETLVYKIIVKNKALKLNYKRDLYIVENLSENVEFQNYSTPNTIKSFYNNSTHRQLIWNIGQLNKGDEVIIEYSVIVTGNNNSIIISTGKVGNISSSTIKNVIGNNLGIYEQNAIKMAYERLLKNKSFSGKELIERIYNDTLGVELNLTGFNITDLIINNNSFSVLSKTIFLNTNHSFYNMVLNNYWSSISKRNYDYGTKKVKVYDLKDYIQYTDAEIRQDFIYPETFKTGDILIYTNYDDKIYNNNTKKNETITNEDGEYAYIYIDGKGFVGVNYENDEIRKRNEFTPNYYYENNLILFQNNSAFYSRTFKNGIYNDEIANLQTLFGKDYYVILRPSLKFKYVFKQRRLSGKSGRNLLKVENKSSQGGYIQFKVLKLVKYILCLLL